MGRVGRNPGRELFPSVGGTPAYAAHAAAAGASGAELSADARRVLEVLAREESLSAEELAQALDLPAAAVLASLFELEGGGLAATVEGGRYGIPRR